MSEEENSAELIDAETLNPLDYTLSNTARFGDCVLLLDRYDF